ncbi:MAG: hypothetical protein ATN35_09290 [Epulopiscium sp. Nele67-Bin004]|nr:MAG: hypothetical protein ATN35_09290 [Epulopiscium sp. Nele67-Bin004]
MGIIIIAILIIALCTCYKIMLNNKDEIHKLVQQLEEKTSDDQPTEDNQRLDILHNLDNIINLYQSIESCTNILVIILDSEYKIKFISEQLLKNLNYTIEDCIEKDFEKIMCTDDYNLTIQQLEYLTDKNNRKVVLENRIKTKNGKWIYFECQCASTIYDEEVYITINLVDVTKRSKMEMDLRTSQDISEFLLNSLDVKIAGLDKDGNVIAINDAMIASVWSQNSYNLTIEDVCMKNKKIIDNVKKVLSGLETQVLFEHSVNKGDEEVWYLVDIKCNEDSGGCMISYTDTTMIAQLGQSLKDKEENQIDILDRLPSAIFATNSSGITFCNNEAVTLIKAQSKDDVVGRMLINYISKPHRRKYIEEFYGVDMRNKAAVKQVLMDCTGKEVSVEIDRAKATINGEITDIYMVRDLRHRQEVARYEERINEMDKELLQNRETDRIKTEFFVDVSHEFRTPINVISSAAQLLGLDTIQADYESGAVNKYTDIIKQNCSRLLRLVSNIIDMTKIESGFYNITLNRYNIVNVVEEITMSLVHYIEGGDIELIFDTEIEECAVEIDLDSIERVVLNLLSNAVKFTPAGGKIEVKIYMRFPNVVISIKDTGIGIPQDKLGIIFERFKQAEKAIDSRSTGSGIGLSLVKSLIELHNGQIEVSSVTGKGSDFRVILPCIEEDVETKDYVYDTFERINVEFSDVYLNS